MRQMGGTNKKLTSLSGSITRSDRLAYNALLLPLLFPALWLLLLLKDVIFYFTFFLPPSMFPSSSPNLWCRWLGLRLISPT